MRGLDYLIPEARRAAEDFLTACKAEGLNALITDTLRTEKEQNDLYAQGRTKPGSVVTSVRYPHSPHNWGVAFDFCKNIRGAEYDDKDGFFEKVGAVAERLGLVWGGHFKRPDRPHIQLARYMPDKTTAELVKTYKSPAEFITLKNTENNRTDTGHAAKVAELRELIREAITSELAADIVRLGNAALALETISTDWERVALDWGAENRVVRGGTGGALMGRKLATRAEVLEMFKNYSEK